MVRANFSTASSGWASLSESDQGSWTAYAAAHPITDSLGQSAILTGHMMYVSITASLLNIGQSPSTSPPASSAVGAITNAVATATVNPVVGVRFDFSDATGYVLCAASKGTSPGVSYQKTFAQLEFDTNSVILQTPDGDYSTYLGTPILGTKIFFRLTPVNQYGVTGAPTIISAIVGAASVVPAVVVTSTVATDITATWSGGTTRDLDFKQSPNPGGPFTTVSTLVGVTSPQTATGATTGMYAVVASSVGGVITPASNEVTVM